MGHPKRKRIRLKAYDYSQNGAYFVTICSKDRESLLSEIVGDGLCAVPQTILTHIGTEIEKSIKYINNNIGGVNIDKYVIMPNHVHMIIELNPTGGDGAPPLPDIIRRFKTYTTKAYAEIQGTGNITLWQRSFYEHVIRNEQDYLEIWEYIENNPLRWEADKYYGA